MEMVRITLCVFFIPIADLSEASWHTVFRYFTETKSLAVEHVLEQEQKFPFNSKEPWAGPGSSGGGGGLMGRWVKEEKKGR